LKRASCFFVKHVYLLADFLIRFGSQFKSGGKHKKIQWKESFAAAGAAEVPWGRWRGPPHARGTGRRGAPVLQRILPSFVKDRGNEIAAFSAIYYRWTSVDGWGRKNLSLKTIERLRPIQSNPCLWGVPHIDNTTMIIQRVGEKS